MAPMNQTSLRRRDEVIAQRVGDTAVLVDLSSNRIYELNTTGARVWELLDTARSVDALVGALVNEFETEPHVVKHEVVQIVGEFAKEGLIEHVAQY